MSRGGQIRTDDFLLPKQALYQAELRPERGGDSDQNSLVWQDNFWSFLKKVFQACDSNKKHRFLIRFAVRIFLQSSNKSASKRKCCVAQDSDIEHTVHL